MSEKKKLYLLDAMALIYRSYFAFKNNPRINSKGLNTSAMFGFTNTLYELLRSEKPTHIGVAIDVSGPTVRHDDFAGYKANRQAMPEDLSISIPYILKIIDAFNIPLLFAQGYEADDVIGTLVKKAEKEGFISYMVTPDKDFGQLISENIYQYKPGLKGEKASILGVKEICEKFEIQRPEQIIDILGLWGDAVDNIPGVPKVGEKTAKELIKLYDNMENVLANAENVKGKVGENLKEFAEQGRFSKMLATIILDAPVEFDEQKLILEKPDMEALKAIFEELEFRALGQKILSDFAQVFPKAVAQSAKSQPDLFQNDLFSQEEAQPLALFNFNNIENTPHNYHLVENPQQRKELIDKLMIQESFCFDTETTGLDTLQSELVGMSFSFKQGEAFYVPLPENQTETTQILKEFLPVFENNSIKTGQNMKFDIAMLQKYGVEVNGRLFDTMIAHYLIEPDQRHNMDFLAETYLNYSPVSIETLIGKKGKNQGTMRQADLEKLKEYAAEDADITLQLKQKLEPLLTENQLNDLFYNIEIPLIPVLAAMENEGVKVDMDVLKDYSIELGSQLKELEIGIYQDAGMSFNIASPKQLGEILFEKLKISDNPKLTKTKQYATGEDILQKMVNKHPIIEKILDHRSLTKLKSTYVDVLPDLINPETGRIHTSYNQAVAATGRLSSNNPNLQNIPIRTERGREIRKAFIPRDSHHTLLAADYSQIELRIIAELSGDIAMQQAFRDGLDIHTATASKVYGVDIKDVTKDMRRNAKTVNFGIVYGISAFGLSERLNIPRNEAKFIIDQYFEKYPGVREYMDGSIRFAREHGYVETIMKRRRYLRDINSSNAVVRQFAERNAINAPIQGSAADMIKIAMIKIHNQLKNSTLQSKMILQVHDELIFDVPLNEVDLIIPIVRDCMVNAIPLSVPVEVEINSGENWLAAH